MLRLGPRPTYDEFRTLCLIPNQPCIITINSDSADLSSSLSPSTSSSFVHDWPAFNLWLDSTKTLVNYEYLVQTYGHLKVSPVVVNRALELNQELTPTTTSQDDYCSNSNSRRQDENETTDDFKNLLNQWNKGQSRDIYLKDWHLPLVLSSNSGPDDRKEQIRGESVVEDMLYVVPEFVRDDWMNEYYGRRTTDDFRFVYAGGGDTVTLLHRDVYCSYSISTNIFGKKRWYMFPPNCTTHLEPYLTRARYKDQGGVDVETLSLNEFEKFLQLGMLVTEQEQGETIFVPSGWYHQVVNLTHPTISINHNWCNAHNVQTMYRAMLKQVEECREAIADVKTMLRDGRKEEDWKYEWVRCVQDLVRQDAGWE
ncbi:hypothetical protein ACM66B_004763 [Microbotryomycetes sp. NB124-2]